MTFYSWTKIAVLVIGIVTGALMYQESSFRWLYVIDSKYLTFTQARMVQSVGRLLNIDAEGKNEDFIIFGGSGAYHSINHHYLNEQLSNKGSDKKIHLVSFSSQSLVNTLALVNQLPKRTGKPGYVVITYSFWRFDKGFAEDLKTYFSFNRTFDFSEAFLTSLDSGEYDYMFENSLLSSDWSTLKKKFNLPKYNRLSTWSKYFILDKINKIKKNRLNYLFVDPPATPAPSVFSDKSLQRLSKKLEKPSILARNKQQMERLTMLAETKFSLNSTEKKNELRTYIRTVLPEIARIARSKGYKVWLYQLPTYRASTKQTTIPSFQSFINEEIQLLEGFDIATFYDPSDYTKNSINMLEQPKMWWDFVHLTNLGALLFQGNFLSQIENPASVDNKQEAR